MLDYNYQIIQKLVRKNQFQTNHASYLKTQNKTALKHLKQLKSNIRGFSFYDFLKINYFFHNVEKWQNIGVLGVKL